MYLHAESVKVDSDEGRFTLEIESEEEDRITVNIHSIDLDAFYDQVKSRLGPYLREAAEARTAVAAGVSLADYLRDGEQENLDELEEFGYEVSDRKHPHFHSIHADIYDNREGK